MHHTLTLLVQPIAVNLKQRWPRLRLLAFVQLIATNVASVVSILSHWGLAQVVAPVYAGENPLDQHAVFMPLPGSWVCTSIDYLWRAQDVINLGTLISFHLSERILNFTMNHQTVSELFFEENYRVPLEQTARVLFAKLPYGSSYAEKWSTGWRQVTWSRWLNQFAHGKCSLA